MMNVAQLKALKSNNISAYRALAAVALTAGCTREFGSEQAKYYRSGAFKQAYTAVKAAVVGHESPFWLNQKYLLDFHKHDRKIMMLYGFERRRGARKALKRLAK